MSYIEEMPLDDKYLTVGIVKVSECGEEIGEEKLLPKKFNCLKHAQIGDEIGVRDCDGNKSYMVIQNRRWNLHESSHDCEPHHAWLTIYGREM